MRQNEDSAEGMGGRDTEKPKKKQNGGAALLPHFPSNPGSHITFPFFSFFVSGGFGFFVALSERTRKKKTITPETG